MSILFLDRFPISWLKQNVSAMWWCGDEASPRNPPQTECRRLRRSWVCLESQSGCRLLSEPKGPDSSLTPLAPGPWGGVGVHNSPHTLTTDDVEWNMFLYLMSPSRKTKTLAPPPLGLGQGGGGHPQCNSLFFCVESSNALVHWPTFRWWGSSGMSLPGCLRGHGWGERLLATDSGVWSDQLTIPTHPFSMARVFDSQLNSTACILLHIHLSCRHPALCKMP